MTAIPPGFGPADRFTTGYDSFLLPPPSRRPEVISADGTRLNVEVYGSDGARTVVLAHGWTCAITFWARQINALLAAGLRVVAYDQRGHGASGTPGPAGYTPEALADDLSAVLSAVLAGDEQAVLAGHSMGGMAMIAFGARHPGQLRRRVAAALLANTGMHELFLRSRLVGPVPLPLARLAKPASTTVMGWTPPGGRVNGSARAIIKYASMSRAATLVDVDFCARLVNSCPPRTRTAFARMLSDLDLDAQVAEFDVPTTVVAAVHDRLTPIWHGRRMAGVLPRLVEFVELPKSGHMGPVQAAGPVNRALLELVATCLPESEPARVIELPADSEQSAESYEPLTADAASEPA